MRKNFILLIAVLFIILLLLVVSSIITIGDKIASISILGAYLFYLIFVVFLIVFVAVPTYKTLRSPTMPNFNSEDEDMQKAHKAVRTVLRNCDLDEKERIEMEAELNALGGKDVLQKFWKGRTKKIDKIIRKNAVSVFTLSAISQKGSIDMLICIITNFTMINKLVKTTGFRPTYLQLAKIYFRVLGASFVAMTVDDLLDEIDLNGIVGGLGLGAIAIKSFADGAINAYLTIRIGYVTKEYIRLGEDFNAQEARARARKAAGMSIKPLILDLKDTVISLWNKSGNNAIPADDYPE